MRNNHTRILCFIFLVSGVLFLSIMSMRAVAQEAAKDSTQPAAAQDQQPVKEEPKSAAIETPDAQAQLNPAVENKPVQVNPVVTLPASLTASQNVTMDFKDADIRNVLKIIAFKSGVNIVTTPDVIGNVTIRMADVPWEMALSVLLKSYGYASERQGNIILVTKMENISKIQSEEPLQTEIVKLKFLDAQDAEKILIPLLTPRGKISVLYSRGQKGWEFGSFKIGKDTKAGTILEKEKGESMKSETIAIERNPAGELVSRKAEFEPSVKSKTLVITDTAANLDRIKNVILPQVDKKPKQVLIETRIMEVNRDKLNDIGFDWGTGSAGATGYATPPGALSLNASDSKTIAGRNLASEFTPGAFNPVEGTTAFPGTYPYKAGLEILFKKLSGQQFEVVLHALEEDQHTNTLSAPRVMTLDNQEAAIMVGYHTPILSSTVTAGSQNEGPTQTQNLDYYQEIGIRLNVVPQVSDEGGYINMIIHPSVTSSTSSITATNVSGTGDTAITSTVNYPIIDVREAQTQILMRDGETVVLGGLLKDVKTKETIGIPYLSKIPLLGAAFKRQIDDIQKQDLLIFITARIIKDTDFTPEELAKLALEAEKQVQNGLVTVSAEVKK
ncbi:MAG: hypothetical protein NTY47_02625 [Candidatus Omnitrophica bacterium]|nr:hypothetical protein [Candidatus Omnitrophota bacterium]